MSTLTKILIVLLSLLCVFLSATAVIYVGSAKNYKQAYEDTRAELTASDMKNKNYAQQLEEKKKQAEELADKLDAEIAAIRAQKAKIEQDFKTVKLAKLSLDQRVESLTAAALKFEQTVGGMEDSLKSTRAELDQARKDEIKLTKNLNEITASLEEKMAQLDAVSAEKKRLLEEKANLENQISGTGSSAVTYTPVTSLPDSATAAIETSASASLQGLVSAVEGSLVSLSIGSADGVQEGMVFHVIRNESFVCDIRVTDVDVDASAGTVQLLQQQPKVGDIASTTW